MTHGGITSERRGGRSPRRITAGTVLAPLLALALAACALPDQSAEPAAQPAAASQSPSPSPTPTPSDTPTPTATPSPSEPPAAPSPSPTPTPSATPAEPTPTPTPTPSEPPAPVYPQRGASGEDVRAVQQRLKDLGYFIQDVDGDFGYATLQAVWAFQKAAGLARDGVVGPKTQAALDAGYVPSARSSSGKVVEIDIDRQILLAVEDGRVVRIINASSGNGETFEAKGRTYRARTNKGHFKVRSQDDRMHASTLELGDMWRPKYFNGAIAVHGSSSIPAYPASHGCVRVSNSAMNWLWDSWGLPIGTPVWVY